MWLEEKVKKYLLHIESGRIIYNLVIKHEYTPNRSVPFELNKQTESNSSCNNNKKCPHNANTLTKDENEKQEKPCIKISCWCGRGR